MQKAKPTPSAQLRAWVCVGKKAKFTYPNYGTPDGYPDYTAHSGQIVTILRKLTSEECGPENIMFAILAEDGWVGHAHRDELRIHHFKSKYKNA